MKHETILIWTIVRRRDQKEARKSEDQVGESLNWNVVAAAMADRGYALLLLTKQVQWHKIAGTQAMITGHGTMTVNISMTNHSAMTAERARGFGVECTADCSAWTECVTARKSGRCSPRHTCSSRFKGLFTLLVELARPSSTKCQHSTCQPQQWFAISFIRYSSRPTISTWWPIYTIRIVLCPFENLQETISTSTIWHMTVNSLMPDHNTMTAESISS